MANEFLPFGTAGGSNVISQAEYDALPARLQGFVSGIALSAQLNKTWRQSSIISSMIGEFVTLYSGADAIDDGDVAALLGKYSNALRRQNLNYAPTVGGTANALTVTLSPAPPTLAVITGTPLRLLIAASNTGAATLNVNGLGVKNIVRSDGTPLLAGDLPSGRIVELVYDGTSFQMLSLSLSSTRTRLFTNLNLYVRTDGNDSNSGLVNSAGGAFLTLQHATNVALTYDCAGFTIQINVAGGTYTGAGAILPAPLVGSSGPLRIIGNTANPAANVVSNTAASGNLAAFAATGGGQIFVDGFEVRSASGDGLYAQGAGSVVQYGNMQFGVCAGYHTEAFGGGQVVIQTGSFYNISGNAQSHFRCFQGGTMTNNGGARSVTIGGGVAVNDFASCDLVSSMNVPGLTFGSITGRRYLVQRAAWITTNGGGVNYFPGTVAGVGANYD